MINLQDICVSFRAEKQKSLFGKARRQVLFDISLKIRRGRCLGILGESGSGKSTLGRIISGILKPDRGEYCLEGQNVYAPGGRKLLQQRLSIVFQDYTTSANPRFRIKDIIAEGVSVYKRRSGEAINYQTEILRLLEMVGLDAAVMERFPHQLSGGQLQRVCIARAIASRPAIILFDEAISSLDAHTQVQIMDILQELKDRLNLTYVFITHDLTAVTYLCDDVIFLQNGRITEHSEVKDLAQTTDPYASRLLRTIVEF